MVSLKYSSNAFQLDENCTNFDEFLDESSWYIATQSFQGIKITNNNGKLYNLYSLPLLLVILIPLSDCA